MLEVSLIYFIFGSMSDDFREILDSNLEVFRIRGFSLKTGPGFGTGTVHNQYIQGRFQNSGDGWGVRFTGHPQVKVSQHFEK
mgnify:CR=1 FL=1